MDIKRLANTYLVLALMLGALLPVMLDLAPGMSIYEFLFLAYLISVFVSLGFVVASGKKERLIGYIKNRRDFALIAGIGLLNYALLEFGLTYAERFVSASLATVVYRTYPLLMLAFLPFVLRERISKYQIAALSLGVIGLGIAVGGGAIGFLSGSNVPIISLLIVVALAGALATVLVKKYSYDMESSMFIFSLANFVLFSALFALNGFPTAAISAGSLVAILYVGIVYNVFVGFMYYGALRMLKTTFVTNVYFLSPFITFIFAYLILGEAIQPYYLVIAVLVTAGILIQKLDRVGGTYRASSRARTNLLIFDVTGGFVDSGEVGIIESIEGGGRVLAAKIDVAHRGHLDNVVSGNDYANVFTESHVAKRESDFVKDVLGAREKDFIIIKAGDADEGERFFADLSRRIDGTEVSSGSDLPKEQD